MLKARKVRASDKAKVEQIVKDIWDGTDYIPLVFDEWVRDAKGVFAAAEDERGELVGFEKLTMLSPRDAWIEGLRKDMGSGVKGVGRFLTLHIFSILSKIKDLKTVRFATYFRNDESVSLFSKLGFFVLEKRDHKFLRLRKHGSLPVYKGNRTERGGDAESILRYVRSSEWVKNNRNGICVSWVVKPYSDEMVRKDFIEKNCALSITEDGRIRALCLYTVREKEDLFISFFEAETQHLFRELLKGVKKIAYGSGQKNLSVVLSRKRSVTRDMFIKSRFRSWESEGDFLLFDFPVEDIGKSGS